MNVLEVFTGNPLNTPVGQRIDKATDGSLPAEDWNLNMEICDIINETDEGPKDGIKAIRKKLSNTVGKDWRAVNYCLVVLETCVKNCGKRFHLQVATRDFLNELVKIISPKNEPSVFVQEKVLSLIQTWADAFRGAADLKAVETVYQELKQKGIDFPATDMDSMAPIHTPRSTVEPQQISPVRPPTAGGVTHQLHQPQQRAHQPMQTQSSVPAPAMMPVRPSPEQISKLRSDIEIVQGNCRVFNEMLNVATPSSPEYTTDMAELLKELNRTCRQMQQRIVVLIEQLSDEQITENLLRVNDDLNNAFLRYDRLERMTSSMNTPNTRPVAGAISSPPQYQPPPVAASTAPPASNEATLIDFGSDTGSAAPPPGGDSLSAQLDNMALAATTDISKIKDVTTSGNAGEDVDFDMFAQSRQFDATKQPAATSYTSQTEASTHTSSLGAAAFGRANPYQEESTDPGASATSSEFDKFLEERAVAGERLPDRQSADSNGSPQQSSRNNSTRQLKKDESENALFAL